MNARGAVLAVAFVVAATAVASGPLVAGVDLTTEPDDPGFGNGSVTVGAVDLPDSATLTAGRFGTEGYALEVPPATVEVRSVTGQARVVYQIDVFELSYSRSTVYVLTAEDAGQHSTLTLADSRLDGDDIDAGAYEARVSVGQITNGSKETLASREITVQVVE